MNKYQIVFLSFVLLLQACATTKVQNAEPIVEKTEKAKKGSDLKVKKQYEKHSYAIDVKPFENVSLVNPEKTDPIVSITHDKLVSRLVSNKRFIVIDRLLLKKEAQVKQQKQFIGMKDDFKEEPSKILNPNAIVTGSIMIIDKTIRIDCNLVIVETGEVVLTESITSKISEYENSIITIADKITELIVNLLKNK